MTAEKTELCKMVDHYKPSPLKRPRKEDKNRGEQSAPSNSADSMELEIWKDFPEDLLEAVISRLPIATFFRFRSVCRKWNSMLMSPSFSEHCAQVQHTEPWFYSITLEDFDNTGAIYDPLMKKWHHPILSSVHMTVLLPIASAGGLICFLDMVHPDFYVCNPLTQQWKKLPEGSVKLPSRVTVGMVRNGSGGYKVLWFGRNGECEMYDSQNNTWAHQGDSTSNITLPLSLNYMLQTVSIDSTIYLLRSKPEGIVSYDMVSGVWTQHLIPNPPNSGYHNLAECGGRIFLVGLLYKNAATCVCIWELQKMFLWKEVDRMPDIWCSDFHRMNVRMICLGNKDLLMLAFRSRKMAKGIVTYDLAKKEWLKVPGCVLPQGRTLQWLNCGIAFYPCLSDAP